MDTFHIQNVCIRELYLRKRRKVDPERNHKTHKTTEEKGTETKGRREMGKRRRGRR